MIPVSSIEQLPIKESERYRTDQFCTLVSVLLALVLLGAAGWKFTADNLKKITYPADSEGITCGLEAVNHPYLYFTSLEDPTKRLCVNKCPTQGESYLSCRPTRSLSCKRNSHPQFFVDVYDTKLEETRLGLFCFPTDDTLKERLLKSSDLFYKYHFLAAYDAIRISFGVAVVLGSLYVLFVHCFNERLPTVIVGGGGMMFVALAILTFTIGAESFRHAFVFKIVFGVLLLIVGLALFLLLYHFRQDLRLCGVFLKHACLFLNTKMTLLLAIPVFMVLSFLLLTLFVFQLLAYWSSGQPLFTQKDVYLEPQGHGALAWTVANFVQFVWGLEFLKHAFSFIVSGYAINYYFKDQPQLSPIRYLMSYHFGSVMAGAFLLNFLSYPDLIFDSLMPTDEINPSIRPVNCCFRLCDCACGWLKPLFELARSESMAYINLTGLPYCNASRYCEYLNRMTNLYNGNQSVNRLYRVGAHGVLVGLTLLASIGYMALVNEPSIWAGLFIAGSSFFIVTFFVSLHADAAEALLITFLAELLLSHNNLEAVRMAPFALKDDLKREHYSITHTAGPQPHLQPYHYLPNGNASGIVQPGLAVSQGNVAPNPVYQSGLPGNPQFSPPGQLGGPLGNPPNQFGSPSPLVPQTNQSSLRDRTIMEPTKNPPPLY